MGLIPLWARVAGPLVLVALAFGGGWYAGAAHVRDAWAAADVERERAANAAALRNAERAGAASAAHERERAALAADLRRARDATSQALRAPISCPASGELGDIALPAGALDGVRSAAGAATH